MNAVEIEEAISALAEQAFDRAEFPFAFLQAFGNKDTTIKRLRKGESNKSDLGGVLQTSNIHIAVAPPGEVTKTLAALKASPATAKAKAKFVLATDGETFEAEDLTSGETVACEYARFPDHFGFFLALAGITTVKQIRESSFDIRATGRLNELYIELLKDNPEWGTAARRHDMNHFMARLIFCFFAEDTDIFNGTGLFTAMIEQMSARDGSDTHYVIGEIFRAMNTEMKDRGAAKLRPWADAFPYVNGGLFSGSTDVPRFSKIARSYLIHIGNLDWTRINPDIFGLMIQAVAEDEERGALGMHYTSVPNILKVLNPLFLDDLREKLEEAGDNPRKLLNLRNRVARIRVFDPACGSGNFLVIAYKQMREIEAEINKRRGEADRASEIPKTNFRGIELRDFPAEIARLALVIAEFQCDVLYRGQKLALAEFLPLDAQNWITCGNAGRFSFIELTDEKGGERLDRAPVAQGDILIADRGFLHPDSLARVLEAGADIVVRAPWKGARWLGADGKPFDLLAALAAAGNAGVLDRPIWIGRKKASPLALRLVAFRKTPEAAERSRAKARRAAQREGNTISGGTLAAAGWVILIASLDANAFDANAIGALYRARWRIELAFKRLKSIVGLEGPPGEDVAVAKTWILAHLLMILLLEPHLSAPGISPRRAAYRAGALASDAPCI